MTETTTSTALIDNASDDSTVTTRDSSERRFRTLSQVLRGVGAIVLVTAASTFLLQSWQAGSGIQRYLTLLGLTVVVSLAAFVCGLGIRERKGARTLLGLVLAIVPIHFGVLAGLLYSQFSWDTGGGRVPPFAIWTAPSESAALLTVAGALALLVPLSYVSFLALSRSQARRLTGTFLALNLPVLLPVRNADVIGAIVALLVVAVSLFELQVAPREPALRTTEGRYVRALLAAPILLLICRAHLYDPTSLLYGLVLLSLAWTQFVLSPGIARRQGQLIQGASVLPAFLGWSFVVDALTSSSWLREGAWIPLLTLPLAGILIVMSVYSLGSGAAYRRVAAALAIAGSGLHLLAHPGTLAAFLCLAVGIATLAYGYFVQQKLILSAGAAGTLWGLIYELRYALEIYALHRWGSLALLGVVTILIAAVIERHHAALIAATGRLRSKVRSWDY